MAGVVLLVGLGACAARPAIPAHVAAAGPADLDVSVLLIGDAGRPAPGFEPVLAALYEQAARDPQRSIVVFLGDNLYPDGLPDSTHEKRPEYERRLDDQVAVLRQAGVRGVFIPGNHDWANGLAGVLRQARFVETRGRGLATFLPRNGCPGPEVMDVGISLRIVLLDTQWWFHREPKPTAHGAACAGEDAGQVMDSLRSILATAGGRRTLVVGHHPLESGGPHGGHFDWTWHIFPLRTLGSWLWIPLPVVGSVYPVSRKLGVKSQDLTSSVYRVLRDSLRNALAERPPLAYASGHEHTLQVIDGDAVGLLLVSGTGIYDHKNPVAWLEETRFAASAAGFMRVDVLRSGRTRLGVFVVTANGKADEAFSLWLD